MKTIRIRKPDDFHIHLRQGELLEMAAVHCSNYFSRAIVMPNTIPPIDSIERMENYKEEILNCTSGFTPLMTFKLLKGMKREQISLFKQNGALAGKLYPAGSTTNSEDGIKSWTEIKPLLSAMEEEGLVLSIHGEDPSAYSLEREKAFIPQIEQICKEYPNLKVVFEHLSSKEGIEAVLNGPDTLAGTITVHHLLMTLDDVIGGSLNPHNFCKPVLKSPEDRQAIQKAVLEGHKKFFFGSDSAPHLISNKENGSASAGVYTTPVTLPLVVQFFMDQNALDKLENFLSTFGADFYGLPHNKEEIEIEEQSWTVPDEYNGVRPMMAGRELQWKVKE